MTKSQDWFEMPQIRKRRFATATWTPLRVSEWIEKVGTFGQIGRREEFFGAATLAIAPEKRPEAAKLSWSSLGIGRNQGVYADREHNTYKPAEIYQYNTGEDLGVELVLVQDFDRENPSQWHLNQDLIFALGLLREGDTWVRPSEDYCEVVRLRRDEEGQPISVEIRTEFLRDYLAARNMSLCVSSYRQRTEVCENAEHMGWPLGGIEESSEIDNASDRFRADSYPIMEGGHFADGSYGLHPVPKTPS